MLYHARLGMSCLLVLRLMALLEDVHVPSKHKDGIRCIITACTITM